MKPRPTPETDAFGLLPMPFPLCNLPMKKSIALSKLCKLWGDKCRRLERERDEAAELLRECGAFVSSDYEGTHGDLTGTNLIRRVDTFLARLEKEKQP